MMERKHILAVCGSLRDESKTRIALREALAGAEAAGATTDLLDLRDLELPMYGAEPAGRDAGDASLVRRQLRAADGVILGTPIYHGSYSSPLKTALDYATREEFENTTAGLLAVAGGRFPTRGLDHLRSVVRYLDAWVVPLEVAIPNSSTTVADGMIRDDELADRTRRLGRSVAQYSGVGRLPELRARGAKAPGD